ncbi:hypothetical protein F0U60_31760 [Archangium minus]|uniref:Lipoprotein n=1 Tax=Archangium minus TaxID=83450 RepID=A0ABY9WYH7_9BACT|nr:hypothetical protein F0U60_31760 [Archangium minus]
MTDKAQPAYLYIHVPQSFIPTQSIVDPDTGRPYFRFTMMEDFETTFLAKLIMSDGSTEDVTNKVHWSIGTFPDKETRPPGKVSSNSKNPNVLRGVERGFVELSAFFEGKATMSVTAELEILESDLLVYAPDGCVYKVPGEIWLGQKEKHSKAKVERITWSEKDRKRLPEEVWNMLANEAVVANVPNPVQKPFDDSLGHAPADNVTCFLLNLNSVALSYSPRPSPAPKPTSQSQKVPKPGRPKSATQAKTPPTRRKR